MLSPVARLWPLALIVSVDRSTVVASALNAGTPPSFSVKSLVRLLDEPSVCDITLLPPGSPSFLSASVSWLFVWPLPSSAL